MARPKLPPSERLGTPVYVLLRPQDVILLDHTARAEKRSRGAVLRAAFLEKYRPLPTKKPRGARR